MKSMLSSLWSSDGSVDEEKRVTTQKFYTDTDQAEDGAVKSFPYTDQPTLAWKLMKAHQVHEVVSPLPLNTPVQDDHVRFVCISDTHNKIPANIPNGDVLLHGGDFTMYGSPQEVFKFNESLGTLPHPQKIVIAGNHDALFDTVLTERLCRKDKNVPWALRRKCDPKAWAAFMREKNIAEARDFLTHCTYLEDAHTNICGISIYGSPWQPVFHSWGFNEERGERLLDRWNRIPEECDVLITHGPPIGHGDTTFIGKKNAGCVELLHSIQQRVKPTYHVFGHIHEGHGITSDGQTTYINASTCTLAYRATNPPIIFDIKLPPGHDKTELANRPDVTSYDNGNPAMNINFEEFESLSTEKSCAIS